MSGVRQASTLVVALLTSSGCIIPDQDIQVTGVFSNPGAVRLVQSIPLSMEAEDSCNAGEREGCPLPPLSQPFGLIDPEQQSFCLCENGDNDRLRAFDILVEDPDVDVDGNPSDDIFGVFLLDVPATGEVGIPSDFIAYENYLPLIEPAVLLPPGAYSQSIDGPEDPNLKGWQLGQEDGVDLCNDNNNDQLPTAGLHTLRLIVTDRPWYVPVVVDDDGVPVQDSDGSFLRDDVDPLIGVPDLPGGASYAVANFVFRCGSPEREGDNCDCAEPVEP